MQFKLSQIVWMLLALLGWALVFMLQDFDVTRLEFRFGQYAEGHIPEGENWRFIINKSLRFLFNDLFSLLLIYGLFAELRYIRIGLLVMALGMFILLPAYLILAIHLGPEGFHYLTFLHRITMNPWLMLLLIPAFFYQRLK